MISTIVILGLVMCAFIVRWGGVMEDCDHCNREQFRKEKEDAEK